MLGLQDRTSNRVVSRGSLLSQTPAQAGQSEDSGRDVGRRNSAAGGVVRSPRAAAKEVSPVGFPFVAPIILKCHRGPNGHGWRVWTKFWVFEDVTLEAAQSKALEIFPKAVFVVYFPDLRPHRPRKKRRRSPRGELA